MRQSSGDYRRSWRISINNIEIIFYLSTIDKRGLFGDNDCNINLIIPKSAVLFREGFEAGGRHYGQ